MSEEILKDLSRVIEKYKDKVFCTGELNYVDMAKSCKLEIERLNEELNCYKLPSCKSDDIEVVRLNLVDMMRKNKRLEQEKERLNNIINIFNDFIEEVYNHINLGDESEEFMLIFDKWQQLKDSDKE